MARPGYDALFPNRIPLTIEADAVILAYVGHSVNLDSYAQALARFPDHLVVPIAAHNAVDATVLDIESGAVDPGDRATILTWRDRQVARGITPTFYCNASTYPIIRPYFTTQPQWWAAKWDTPPNLNIPGNAVGIQYGGSADGGYDLSMFNDYIEGFDMALVQADEPIITAGFEAAAGQYYGAPGVENFMAWVGDFRGVQAEFNTALMNRLDILQAQITALTPGGALPATAYDGTIVLTPKTS